MDHNDREQLRAFFGRSRYDIIQARQSDGCWGSIWTFAPCDPRAAAKAARMLLRMHEGKPLQVRHARRARLHDRQHHVNTDVVVMTELPERTQEVIGLADGIALRVPLYLQDDALTALAEELGKQPR